MKILVVSVLVLLGLVAAPPALALAAEPSPPPARMFGPEIEGYAANEPQQSCMPGVRPGTDALRTLALEHYGVGRDGGITRDCAIGQRSEHKEGRAWDWMLDAHNPDERAVAENFLGWLLATDEHGNDHAMARRLGVSYVIWAGSIWSAARMSEGWRPYTGPHPHLDHIHVTLSWAGAQQQTSYWTAPEAPDEPLPLDEPEPDKTPVIDAPELADELADDPDLGVERLLPPMPGGAFAAPSTSAPSPSGHAAHAPHSPYGARTAHGGHGLTPAPPGAQPVIQEQAGDVGPPRLVTELKSSFMRAFGRK